MSSFLSHQQTAIEFAALNRRIVAKRFLKIVDGNLSFDNLAILLLDQVNSCVQKETFTVKDESGSGIATGKAKKF